MKIQSSRLISEHSNFSLFLYFHDILLNFFDRMFLARIPMGPWTLSCISWDSYSDPFSQTCCSLFHCRGLTLRYLPYTPVGKISLANHFSCGTMSCYFDGLAAASRTAG